jgi:type III secretion system FlhB-like substrate exporter
MGLRTREVNIWTDSSAAAVVRGYAGGNETVPTVVVAGRGYVNPSADVVLEHARAADPGLTLDMDLVRSADRVLMLRRLQGLLAAALSVAGFVLLGAGNLAVGGALDAAAALSYMAFRAAISRVMRITAP